MTPTTGTRRLTPNARLFTPLKHLSTLFACLTVSVQHYALGKITINHGDVAVFDSNRFSLRLHLPISGPVEAALFRIPISYLEITIVPNDEKLDFEASTGGFADMARHLISPIFVDFYENHLPWIKDNFGGPGGEAWPPVFDFVRVIRNACSHGGRLAFASPTGRAVNWRGITYAPSNQGMLVVCGHLSLADMLFLMLDFSDELDAHYCPNPLA